MGSKMAARLSALRAYLQEDFCLFGKTPGLSTNGVIVLLTATPNPFIINRGKCFGFGFCSSNVLSPFLANFFEMW
jgi:hypothetical protein